MKKLAEKLGKVDIRLPKWTRNLLYEHLLDICDELKNNDTNFKKNSANNRSN